MPIDTLEIIDAISILTNERNMRVAIRQAGKGSLICAATAFIGGLLLGPAGLAIGGTVGGLTGMAVTNGKFKSVAEIIKNDLTRRQQQELVERVAVAVRQVGISDVAMLATLMVGNPSVQQAVLRTVTSFVTNQLSLQIVD